MKWMYLLAALAVAALLAWAVRRCRPMILLLMAGFLMTGSIVLICLSLSVLEGHRLVMGCIAGGLGVCLLGAAAFKASREANIRK